MAKAKKKKTVKKKTAKKVSKKAAPKVSVVHVGELVSEFALPSTREQEMRLSDFKGKRLVLYFYPKDATPGCTLEGHDFTRLKGEFETQNTIVFGISRDSIKSHNSFCQKEGYTIDLLSDEKEEVCQLFDVIKMKNMYGKQVRGIERSTFVIDENGRLLKEWRGVKVPGHAEEVLSYIRSFRGSVSGIGSR